MINVIGLGYIGLPTALMLAAHGVEVVGTDYNAELVATLNAGKTTFKEKGLDELFADAIKGGIKFTTEYQVTDTYVVSVPTPYDKFTKKVDACYVIAALKSVMAVCPKGATVVIESTVSPGTIDKYVRPAIEANGFKIGEDIHLVHAPERIIPGNMIYELLHNNRTIGADDRVIGEKIKALYASFCLGDFSGTAAESGDADLEGVRCPAAGVPLDEGDLGGVAGVESEFVGACEEDAEVVFGDVCVAELLDGRGLSFGEALAQDGSLLGAVGEVRGGHGVS